MGKVGPQKRWLRGRMPIPISVPSCNGSGPGTTGPVGRTYRLNCGRLRYYGGSGNGYTWYAEYCTVGSMSWRDRAGGTTWSFLRTDAGSFSNGCREGPIGAHLGPARTLALVEQGFYWPGMRADVSKICIECDCAMLKRRRGQREPLHQCIVGVPMERLAMDVAGPYPITSTGNQYCLMVGCYFSK